MNQRKLGSIIKRMRNIHQLTQAQLAEQAGISVNYIGDIENGRKAISLKILFMIAHALGMRVDHLLSFYYDNSENVMNVEFQAIKQAYQSWKNLNEIIAKNMASRKVNFPEPISENIACHALNLTRNVDNSGDATDENGKLVEIKATANFHDDLTSFSPKTHFDRLVFVRMNTDEDKAYIYDLGIDGKTLGNLPVNKTETVADHQAQNRRPRLSLIKYIESNEIPVTAMVDLG